MKLGKKLFFCILMLMMSFTLYGCFNGRNFEIQELGDWLYQDNGENSCAIMGLSETGKKCSCTTNGTKWEKSGLHRLSNW